jgi:hypothetical protein
MHTNATKWGLYCPEHGLQFLTEEEYNKNVQSNKYVCQTVNCTLECEFEEKLWELTMQGCDFCKKPPTAPTFMYDEKVGKIYCHGHCYMAARRRCATRGCSASSKVTMMLVIDDPSLEITEFLVPVTFCLTCADHLDLPMPPNDEIWKFISESMASSGNKVPDRASCRLELRKY